MKGKLTTIVVTLGVLLWLATFAASAQAQQPPTRFRADTGGVTPGLGQILRITIGAGNGTDRLTARFAWMKYMPAACNNDGVCRHQVVSQGATSPVTLDPGEAASFDVQGTGAGARVIIRVDTANQPAAGRVRATAEIINLATGEVVSHVIMANTEGD